MFKFPFTNFHELNLDWVLSVVKKFADLIPPMETAVDDVQEALGDANEAVQKADSAIESANEAVETANEAKDIAEEAAQGIIPNGAVTTPKLADGAVVGIKIANGAVGPEQMADDAVRSSKIYDGAVTTAKLAGGSVTTPKLEDSAVTSVKIKNGAVTKNKLEDSLKNKIISDYNVSLPSNSTLNRELIGLTENHVVIHWGFSNSPENKPPCGIKITTRTNGYTIETDRNTTETFSPVFCLN